ncbi:hypothetical protein GQ600_24006 [Phytophthora cactorum]|nr:hypothetical protein GQ600_24006 [Phytophthora cactorum]
MDENAVPPRLIWNNLLRAPDVPKPVLGYPSYAQVQRSVRYIRWLQGQEKDVVGSGECLTDDEKVSASAFYRSAVKW